MVCKNCNSLMPDGLDNCPKCGAAVNQQPEGYDPFAQNTPAQQYYNAPAGSGSINIGGRVYRLSYQMILPAVMVLFIIIGMFGAFSFKTAKLKFKTTWGGSSVTSDAVKYKFSDCTDADLGFSKFANGVCILCDVAAAAGLIYVGYTLMTTKNGVNGLRAMVIPTTAMLISFMFVIFNAFYIKGKMNSMLGFSDSVQAKGGPTFITWFFFAVFVASTAACRKFAEQVSARNLAEAGRSGGSGSYRL